MSDDDFDEPPSRPAPLLENRASYIPKALEDSSDDSNDIVSVSVPAPIFVIRKQPSVHDVSIEAPHGENLIPPKRPPPPPPANTTPATAPSPATTTPITEAPPSPAIDRIPSNQNLGVLLSTQIQRSDSSTNVMSPPTSPQAESERDKNISVVKEARWFILTNNSLTYYLDPSQKVAKGVIDLANRADITVTGGKDLALEFKTKDRPNCFKLTIKSKNKDFIIDAQTLPEMQGWVRVIAQVLEGKWDKQ